MKLLVYYIIVMIVMYMNMNINDNDILITHKKVKEKVYNNTGD